MSRRKAPAIPDEMLDQLLSGAEASTAFDRGGLLDRLKKALAERALNAEMDHHLAGEGGSRNSRNGYGARVWSPTPAGSRWWCRGTGRAASTRS
jgi:putative transposase